MKKLLRLSAITLCLSLFASLAAPAVFAEEDDDYGDESQISEEAPADDDNDDNDDDDDDDYDQDYSSGFDPDKDTVWSEAVYMVNIDTGDVVYKKNENKKMYPASTTKIMTAIIALEAVRDWNEKVEVPYECFDEFYSGDPNKSDVSNAAIEPLQSNLSYKDCIYALMLPSGCEAANILAYNIGKGDMNKFFDMMNAKAKEIGCTGTNFSDAHGLFEPENYTTVKDMYLITKYALDNLPRFTEVCGTYEYKMPANDANPDGYYIYSTISLINPASMYYYEGAYGIKTGTTDQSGRCLVSAAKKQFNYVIVSMGAPLYDSEGNYYDDWYSMVDHNNLYDWAFDTFAMMTVVNKEDRITEVEVKFGENASHVVISPESDFTALLPKNIDQSNILKTFTKYDEVTAPVAQGDILGVMDVKYRGETIATLNLVANSDVVLSQVDFYIERIKVQMGQTWFQVSVTVFVIFVICFIVFRSVENAQRRKAAEKEKKRFENYAANKKHK
ncbi:MAG: D-alanyl-D-alanine carboxypeptidase [Eubacterium sp.]|nr:D-alanyl-D-alanine carboxypeptidase [Eubacterium sp.]